MSINSALRNFFLYISKIDFDKIFYDGKTGKNIYFKNVFPQGKYAIIGNSPISLEKKNGVNIDLYDYIIRFNNFQVVNYEIYIGMKTSVWVTGGGQQSPNNLPICLDQKTMKKVLVMNKNLSFKEKQLQILNKYGEENLSSFIIFHNEVFLNKVITLIQGIPTTGFLIILLLAAKYRNIDTYGFSFGTYKQKYHYYADSVIQDYGHRWKNELILFQEIVRKKLVNNYDIVLNNNAVKNTRYYKHLPKPVKQLYKQPYNNVHPTNVINNLNIQHSVSITEDTNNKILEIHKMLNTI